MSDATPPSQPDEVEALTGEPEGDEAASIDEQDTFADVDDTPPSDGEGPSGSAESAPADAAEQAELD